MAVAAIAALSSCSSDNDFEENQTGKQALVFTATMENGEGSRATFDSGNKCAAWEAGDQISINSKTYSAQEAGATTTFKAVGEGATGETYVAYFPADLYNGTTATLPAIQTYEEGEFKMPMYAESTNTELAFKNLCAVLAVKVTSADIAKLKSIKVTSDKKLNGSFTVADSKAVMGTDGTNTVVLESSSALTLTSEGTTFYIAIPAQEYKYLNIFLSADGSTYKQAMATKKAAGLGSLARSKMFNIDYAKNATKLSAGNLFFADCNIGATLPEEFGGYYTWGGTYNNNPAMVGYTYTDDHNTGRVALSGDTDTAYKLWGSNWRMPTSAELQALLDNCDGQWTTVGGVKGNKYTGKSAYSSNSVFLPAAGYCLIALTDVQSCGRYWSSTSNGGYWAYFLRFGSNQGMYNDYPNYCYPVRPVLDE